MQSKMSAAPLFPFSSAAGKVAYESFLDVPDEIKHMLMFRMDYYTLAALTATCSQMATWRENHVLFRDIIAEDVNEHAASARGQCSFRYYGTLLLSRWRCANILVDVFRNRGLHVFGGWVRDMFAGALLFHDVDVRVEAKTVAGALRQWTLVEASASQTQCQVQCPDLLNATVTDVSKASSTGWPVHERHGYDGRTTTYLVRCDMGGDIHVSFRVQFVHDVPLIREADLDVNGFYIVPNIFTTFKLGVWSKQFLDKHAIRECIFAMSIRTETGREFTSISASKSSKPFARSVKNIILDKADTNSSPLYHAKRILHGCQTRVMLPAFPLRGTFSIVGLSSLHFDYMHKDLRALNDGRVIAPATILSHDTTITRYGRRYLLMQQRGWTLLPHLYRPPLAPMKVDHFSAVRRPVEFVLDAAKIHAFGSMAETERIVEAMRVLPGAKLAPPLSPAKRLRDTDEAFEPPMIMPEEIEHVPKMARTDDGEGVATAPIALGDSDMPPAVTANEQVFDMARAVVSGFPTLVDCVRLTVHSITGATHSFTVSKTITIEELKERAEVHFGVTPPQQRLIYDGRALADERTLESYNITENAVLHLVGVLRGD